MSVGTAEVCRLVKSTHKVTSYIYFKHTILNYIQGQLMCHWNDGIWLCLYMLCNKNYWCKFYKLNIKSSYTLRKIQWIQVKLPFQLVYNPPVLMNGANFIDISWDGANYGHVVLNKNEIMMTSSNGNIFRVTGPLCGELNGHPWIPHTEWRAALMLSLICVWTNGWVNNKDAGYYSLHIYFLWSVFE